MSKSKMGCLGQKVPSNPGCYFSEFFFQQQILLFSGQADQTPGPVV